MFPSLLRTRLYVCGQHTSTGKGVGVAEFKERRATSMQCCIQRGFTWAQSACSPRSWSQAKRWRERSSLHHRASHIPSFTQNTTHTRMRKQQRLHIPLAFWTFSLAPLSLSRSLALSLSLSLSLSDADDNTPLHWAAVRGHPKATEYLIKCDADVNFKNKGELSRPSCHHMSVIIKWYTFYL